MRGMTSPGRARVIVATTCPKRGYLRVIKAQVFCIFLLAATTGAQAAEPVVLWNGVPAGLSRKDVEMKFPDGRPSEANFRIDRVMLGRPASVTFVFSNERLSKVAVGIKATMEEAKSALRSYGAPLGCESVTRDVALCRWRKGGVQIEARTFSISEPYTQIDYTAGVPDSAAF